MAGTSIGLVEAISNSNKTVFIGKLLKVLLAVIIFIFGFYLLYLGF